MRIAILCALAALAPPVRAQQIVSAEAIAAGERVYSEHCAACHGAQARPERARADLRIDPRLADAAAWRAGVRARHAGKPALADAEIEAVRAYVLMLAGRASGTDGWDLYPDAASATYGYYEYCVAAPEFGGVRCKPKS